VVVVVSCTTSKVELGETVNMESSADTEVRLTADAVSIKTDVSNVVNTESVIARVVVGAKEARTNVEFSTTSTADEADEVSSDDEGETSVYTESARSVCAEVGDSDTERDAEISGRLVVVSSTTFDAGGGDEDDDGDNGNEVVVGVVVVLMLLLTTVEILKVCDGWMGVVVVTTED
jgi:hypothetical protein